MNDDLADIYGEPTGPAPPPQRMQQDHHITPSMSKVLALEARLAMQERTIARLQADVATLKSLLRQRNARAPVRLPIDAEPV